MTNIRAKTGQSHTPPVIPGTPPPVAKWPEMRGNERKTRNFGSPTVK